MFELNNFSSIQIGVASPDKIRSWSKGEVTKGETINYRTLKPEKDGLFCEVIFGPVRSRECACGKCKQQNEGTVCEKCGVLVTDSKVRRERMGHIELAAPVSHIWYYKGSPSPIAICLDIGAKDLESILYLDNKFIVIDPGTSEFTFKQIIDINELREAQAKFGFRSFVAKTGAEAIKQLLSMIDLEAESKALREEVATSEGARKLKASKRLDYIEAFRMSGNRPEWMILDVIPVLPPDIRPMVALDGGRFAASDLNELYRRVIQRNNRLKKEISLGAPEVILRNEKRLLQEAVDSLFDNGRHGKPIAGPGGRPYKSLTNMLKGKQGRFRQNLLGKRVDYSGRSVIVVGPELKMHQCGLPKEMALELFKPFIIRKLVEYNYCANHNIAKKYLKTGSDVVWNILEEVIKDHPVMLNRAPTLHRLGIQAFEPILVEGRAIKLHPLACTAFNADFDGDQMAVHVPLSLEAQAEARFLMLSTNNILKLSDGEPVVSPSQDMVIGSYYLTIDRNALVLDENGNINPIPAEEYRKRVANGEKFHLRAFKSFDEAFMAYQLKEVGLQDIVSIRCSKDIEIDVYGTKMVKTYTKMINSTVGRFIFNKSIPQDIGFVKRYNPELPINNDETSPEYNSPAMNIDLEIEQLAGKSMLSKIVNACFIKHGSTITTDMLDKVKSTGYKYSTVGAVTTSVFDMTIPPEKKTIVEKADAKVAKLERAYAVDGVLTQEEKSEQVKKVWRDANDELKNIIKAGSLGKFNPIHMMCNSGARGNIGQINQLCGMRGLLRDTTGKELERPVKANFREGLSVLEYFISTHGGRKGLTDTALKTADSGYLTRKLVDVAQDCIVNEEDCGDTKGFVVKAILSSDGDDVLEPLKDRIRGRYCMDDVLDPVTGEVLVEKDTLISRDQAEMIDKAGVKEVRIRSVLSCKSRHGICAKCYGANMASGRPVKIGEAVGVIAAQSIGEPGTQLTMRTFHTGGVASTADITQGLPRVTELFEARRPANGEAFITKVDGTVEYDKEERLFTITKPNGEKVEYRHNYGLKPLVGTGDKVLAGDPLTKGSIYPKDLLSTRGVKGVQEYLIKEVQSAYRSNGVEINDKHTEVIVRQMLKKVEISSQGDTDMLVGEKYDIFTYEDNNEKTMAEGGMPATAKRVLLGITQASLEAESFLSAASFQNTALVLTKAAIKNKVDNLRGLKENVILGKLIPAGTGMKCYQGVDATLVDSQELNIVETDEHIDKHLEDYESEDTFADILNFSEDN